MRAAHDEVDAGGELIMLIPVTIKPDVELLGNCWGLNFEKPASAMAFRTGKWSRLRSSCRSGQLPAWPTTTRGVLTLAEYNRLAQETRAAVCCDKYRFLCETWVKYHHDTPLADELYRLTQSDSRLLKGAGAGLRRADVEALRGSAD